MSGTDPETFAWLLTPPGQELLAAAARVEDPIRDGARLREAHSPERVAAALTQVDLRRRAEAKLPGLADRLWFTPDGLEQATRRSVAEHRAARLAAAGVGTVTDLGCGIGGDLLALAGAGLAVTGVELDPLRVAVARANLAALGLPGEVHHGDVTDWPLDDADALLADPARRTARGRSFDVQDWTPPWDFVLRVLARDAVVKVAPGIPHALVPDGVEAEWVSDGGEVKEAALWSGRFAGARRRATLLPGGTTVTDAAAQTTHVEPVGGWLHEPDGAVIRAGLVGAVAAAVGGGLLDPHIAYVTAATDARTPLARRYRVLEQLPYREKQLRAALRERRVGRLTIKKRGVAVDPAQLRKRLALSGDREATLVLTRVDGHGTALLVDPAG